MGGQLGPSPGLARDARRERRLRLAFTAACALPAVAVGWFTGRPELLWSAVAASLVCAWLLWRGLMTGREARWVRAACVGALTAVVAHGGTWLVIAATDALTRPAVEGCAELSCRLADLAGTAGPSLLATVVSLVFFGPFTVPAGALIGLGVALAAGRGASA